VRKVEPIKTTAKNRMGLFHNNPSTVSCSEWRFGRPVCQFFLSIDYTASTASIFNLFILSLDRLVQPVRMGFETVKGQYQEMGFKLPWLSLERWIFLKI
jgi:hypothetical protein